MTKFFAVLFTFALAIPAFSADEPAKAMDPKKAEMMKAFMQYSTPGAEHKVLHDLAGKWTYTSKWWEPGTEKAEESKGKSSMKMIMGGRYLQHETKGKSMGMPFEGMGLTGYNNLTQKFETLWLDNMATGMMAGNGAYDAESKTFKDSGEFTCPLSKKDNKKRAYRSEWKIVDKKHTVFTMWMNDDDGKEAKAMEMSFTRVN